jgi:HSP20 family molecular chaperone IbpA
MKKKDNFDEFIKSLKEAVENMQDDCNVYRPIFIDISVNIIPNMDFMPAGISVKKADKIPVDVIETEKKVHAMISLSGMEKDSIKLSCNGNALEITASNAETTLNEMIKLPAKVVKKGMKATFENEILEVIFNKSRRQKQ